MPAVTAMVFDHDAQKVSDRDRLNQFLALVPPTVAVRSGSPGNGHFSDNVLADEQARLRITTGASVRSSARPYVFQHAGIPVAQTLDERSAPAGNITGVSLGMTALANWEVRRWGRSTVDENE